VRQEAVEAVKAAPPVGYIAGILAGFDWGTFASFLACVYTAWLLAEKLWKWLGPKVKAWRAKRRA
jgi:hypothetical protein